MKLTIRAGIAALALTAFAAQPVYAHPVTSTSKPLFFSQDAGWVAYGFGTMLCAGLAFGKQDVNAAKWHTTVTHKQRLHAALGCAIPFIGLAKVIHGKDWW